MVLSAGGLVSETYCFNADTSEGNFTILNNTCIRDSRLSLKAKGLHTYFMSLPPKWNLYKSELVKHSKDGMESVNSAIKELVKFGYVEITAQQRTSSGQFSGKAYGFHAKPIKDIPEGLFKDFEHRQGFPATVKPLTVKPLTEKPLTEKPQLLTTNKLNTNLQRTELTNLDCKSETVQPVSESVFVNIIKSLFGGEYPFDKNFEADVLKHLTDADIEETNLEAYLKYVFERTKFATPIKSFKGLYRKLALANSILRDFKLSASFKQKENVDCSNPHERKYECPICHTVFDEYDYYCPKCSLTVDAIKNNNEQEITIKSKLYHMAAVERSKLDEKYKVLIAKKGRGFLTADEQIQFYKDNGILN